MRDLQDLLHHSYDGHARQVQARGPWDQGRQRAAMSSIRRRRTARAAGVGGASLFAVGALAVAAMNLPSARTVGPAAPTPSGDWCDVDPYLPANIDAMGDAGYLGRAYIDLSTETFIFVHPDGERRELTATLDGRYLIPGHDVAVWESDSEPWATRFGNDIFNPDGSMVYSFGFNADVSVPFSAYEWTTVVPDDVPPGIDTRTLSAALMNSLGFERMAAEPLVVPAGLTAAIVVTRADGLEEEHPLTTSDAAPSIQEIGTENLVSIEIRVTDLPGGETFSIVSTYDPTQVPGYGCAPQPSPSPDPSANAVVDPNVDPFEQPTSGVEAPFAPLHGPESAVFACFAPLPAELEDVLNTQVIWASGVVILEVPGYPSGEFDVGDRGVAMNGEFPVSVVEEEYAGEYWPSWSGTWVPASQGFHGALYFEAWAWELNGEIVAVSVYDPTDPVVVAGEVGLGEFHEVDELSQIQGFSAARVDPTPFAAMCDGSPDDTLGDANLVVLQGAGSSPADMTYSWTRVTE